MPQAFQRQRWQKLLPHSSRRLSRQEAHRSPGYRLRARPFLECLEERCLLTLFEPAIVITGGHELAAGHFTSDGKLDLAGITRLPGASQNTLQIMQFVGTTLQVLTTTPTDLGQPVVAADVNGDGKLDLIGLTSGGVEVLLGNGDGTFQAPKTSSSPPLSFTSLAVGDFNGDGKLDVVALGQDSKAYVFLGNGDGTFQTPRGFTFSTGGFDGRIPAFVAVGDFNGDHKLDVAVTRFDGGMALLLGNGDGTLAAPTVFDVGPEPGQLVVADFRNDGKLDVAVSDGFANAVTLLLGNGDGTFAAPQRLTVGPSNSAASDLAVGDFNGDGKLDLAVIRRQGPPPNKVSVLFGNGDGSFAPFQAYPIGGIADQILAGDFNGDGRLDVVTNDVSVLLNGSGITGGTANQRFVDQLYHDLLHRPADPGGLAFFTGLLDQGMTRSQVALAIEGAPEYHGVLVESLYGQYLGRAADPGGLTDGVNFLAQGGTTPQLTAFLLGSDEYFANHGRSNINFVHGLYLDVIPQHFAQDGGPQSWARLLDAGTSRTLVALAILQSPEGIQEQVELLYLRLLRREADPGGLNTFTAALEAGLPSSLALALIVGSDEYLSEV